MKRQLALKRLTRSDLTLFESQFRKVGAGNQKAINLNADVFVGEMFPALPSEASARSGRFPLDLDIYGPERAPRLNLQRKIIKLGEYKNWRLNGEFIANPPDAPQRFDALQEGDIALFEFRGLHVPEFAAMALISQASEPGLHSALSAFLGSRRMAVISPPALDGLLHTADVDETFPITGEQLEESLEDAAQGGLAGTRQLQRRAATRAVSKEDLRAARVRADEIGALGEEFVNDHLLQEKVAGRIASFKWDSMTNAVAPHDFTVEADATGRLLLDVKSTMGPFDNPVHISISELLCMQQSDVDYRLYRVYKIDGRRAKMRVSGGMRTFAAMIVQVLERLPDGVMADGVSVDPSGIDFGPELTIELREDDT